jgi:hypothetical protein
VLGASAVRDVTGAEGAEGGDQPREVPERPAEQHQHVQQHRLLPCHVDGREERLDRRGHGEEPGVEDVHQLVAARRDEVEAGFESLRVDVHGSS